MKKISLTFVCVGLISTAILALNFPLSANPQQGNKTKKESKAPAKHIEKAQPTHTEKLNTTHIEKVHPKDHLKPIEKQQPNIHTTSIEKEHPKVQGAAVENEQNSTTNNTQEKHQQAQSSNTEKSITANDDDKASRKKEYDWYCIKCHKVYHQKKEPHRIGCTAGGLHNWIKS